MKKITQHKRENNVKTSSDPTPRNMWRKLLKNKPHNQSAKTWRHNSEKETRML